VDERRRPAGQAERFPALLDDQARRDEVTDESADAAARQTGALTELAARQRSVGVQRPHQRAQVGAPDALAALPFVTPHASDVPPNVGSASLCPAGPNH
jgi:hypothetical protein